MPDPHKGEPPYGIEENLRHGKEVCLLHSKIFAAMKTWEGKDVLSNVGIEVWIVGSRVYGGVFGAAVDGDR